MEYTAYTSLMRYTAGKARRRKPLSRAVILRTALAIADAEGREGLTVRRLAQALGVTPMAIYRHCRNKDAIERGLVDLVVGDYDVTNHDERNWRDWLCKTCGLMRRGLIEHPAIIPLLSKATYAGSDAMTVLERILHELRGAGFTPRGAAGMFHALMAYTIGSVTLGDSNAPRTLRREFTRAPRARYPQVVEAATALADHFEGRRFEAGVRAIIDGLADTVTAPRPWQARPQRPRVATGSARSPVPRRPRWP